MRPGASRVRHRPQSAIVPRNEACLGHGLHVHITSSSMLWIRGVRVDLLTQTPPADMLAKMTTGMDELLIRYYEDQWTHIRHHESLMSSQTFQAIAFAGAVLLAMSQMTPAPIERIGFSVLILALGLNGLLLTRRTHAAVRIHMARARSAHGQLPEIDRHAIDAGHFPDLYLSYKIFHVALISLGAILGSAALASAL